MSLYDMIYAVSLFLNLFNDFGLEVLTVVTMKSIYGLLGCNAM
jgi:hypothetical protein